MCFISDIQYELIKLVNISFTNPWVEGAPPCWTRVSQNLVVVLHGLIKAFEEERDLK